MQDKLPLSIVEEPFAGYYAKAAAEDHQLQAALLRTDMENFQVLMRLIGLGKMLEKAVITHKEL